MFKYFDFATFWAPATEISGKVEWPEVTTRLDRYLLFIFCKTAREISQLCIFVNFSSVTMPKRCVIYNCSNTNKSGHSVHEFPKDEARRRQWIRFVQVKRANFTPPSVKSQAVICSAHFEESCYPMDVLRLGEFTGGLMSMMRNLKPGSIPTIQPFIPSASAQKRSATDSSVTATSQDQLIDTKKAKRSRAAAKLAVARVRK